MKVLNALLLGLVFVSTVATQTPSGSGTSSSPQASSALDPPGVTVTQFKWHKEVYVPALYEDPMRPSQDHAELVREQKQTLIENSVRAKDGREPKPLPTSPAIHADDAKADKTSSVSYVYEARITNSATKTISAIVWEYSFLDPKTEVELGHHRFTSTIAIRPGKTVNVIERSASPPIRVVVARESGKDLNAKNSEHVSIERIEYDNGSFWQRSPD